MEKGPRPWGRGCGCRGETMVQGRDWGPAFREGSRGDRAGQGPSEERPWPRPLWHLRWSRLPWPPGGPLAEGGPPDRGVHPPGRDSDPPQGHGGPINADNSPGRDSLGAGISLTGQERPRHRNGVFPQACLRAPGPRLPTSRRQHRLPKPASQGSHHGVCAELSPPT